MSPDGKTLLILTSGFNLNLAVDGSYQAQDSGEYVFVYDISTPRTPVKAQVVQLVNGRAFDGIIWSPDGFAFYVAGGADDNVHTFTQTGGTWAESGTPISLGHYCDIMCQETFTGPTAALLGITADGTTLFVANHENDSITSVDLVHGVVLPEYDLRPGIINLAQTGVPGGEFPYGVAVMGNNTVYVSSVRDREIDVLNFSNGVLTLTNRIPVAGNPEKMTLNAAQSKLFVVANNSDELIIIDTAANAVIGEVNASRPCWCSGQWQVCPEGEQSQQRCAFSRWDDGIRYEWRHKLRGRDQPHRQETDRRRAHPNWLVPQFRQRQSEWFHPLRRERQERRNPEPAELPLLQQ